MSKYLYKSKKICNLEELSDICKKRGEKKIVFTNGCFDLIHVGHVDYLRKSRELGDILIVGLNSDASVKRIKGDTRPINSEDNRVMLLEAFEFVDYIYVFDESTPINVIKKLQPDIYTKGGDYELSNVIGPGLGSDIIEEYGGEVVLIPICEDISSSKIIKRLMLG